MPNSFLNRRGLMLILSSPSGAGKTTLSKGLIEVDNNISMSVSVTTRAKRVGERDGIDYNFISKEQYQTMIENDELLEFAKVFADYYGTPKKNIEELLQQGHDVLFDIDWQGAAELTKKAREDIVSVFVLPPSLKELENRLRNRAQDSEEVVERRMAAAKNEISHWHAYDYIIINEDINISLNNLISILNAERLKRTRNKGIEEFVRKMLIS